MNAETIHQQERTDFIKNKLLSDSFLYHILTNKSNESVLLAYNFSTLTIEFRLYKLDAPLQAKHDMYCFATKNRLEHRKAIYIDDISGKEKRKGHGSIILQELMEYARSHSYTEIYGTLTKQDLQNTDEGLFAFYASMGASFYLDHNQRKCFSIKLD